ncbi:MAG: GNAT family N-acetyltransferase [Magnetococcales bacterium]|nr:GNAT family N-acetyltransferase [Magnetococcales bacterium]
MIFFANHPDFKRFWEDLTRGHALLHPFYLPGHLAYAREYFGTSDGWEDLSLVVVEEGRPVLGVIWSLPAGGTELSACGRPVACVEAAEATTGQLQRAHLALKRELERLTSERRITGLHYVDPLPDGNLTRFGEHLLDLGGRAVPFFSSIVDLTRGQAALWGEVRKSYKSLIHWGLNHLVIRTAFDEVLFAAFQALHLREAGRQTRSARSWELQAAMIRDGEAFMVTGELEGELVSAALFIYSASLCYYGVSAARRDLFDKPLSHAILWTAIQQAGRLGCRAFEMGEQLYPNQGDPRPDQKNLNIAKFKRGFGGQTRLMLNIDWRCTREASENA